MGNLIRKIKTWRAIYIDNDDYLLPTSGEQSRN